MNYTLHKLPEGFILTSNEQPLRDYKGLMLNTVVNRLFTDMGVSLMGDFKKVIAQQDQIDFSNLTEEKQKEIGWFDVEKALEKILCKEANYNNYWKNIIYSNPTLISAIQELLSDKRFTLEDMDKAINLAYVSGGAGDSYQECQEFVKEQILSQQSWKVELEIEWIKDFPKSGGFGGAGSIDIQQPKLTNGKVKILKLI